MQPAALVAQGLPKARRQFPREKCLGVSRGEKNVAWWAGTFDFWEEFFPPAAFNVILPLLGSRSNPSSQASFLSFVVVQKLGWLARGPHFKNGFHSYYSTLCLRLDGAGGLVFCLE